MENFIQAYISNISFSKSIEEIISKYNNYSEITTLDPILYENSVEWTAPKWVKKGDIVFFMFSKTSIDTIHHLIKVFIQNIDSFSTEVQELLKNALFQGEELYKKYGGSIFAVGRVSGNLTRESFAFEENYHWKGRIYAPINEIIILNKPVHISEFNSFLMISRQSSITPLFGNSFEKIKDIVLSKKNDVKYLINTKSCPIPLAKINSDNWYEVSNKYRCSFFLEYQFREFFVDYFLTILADSKNIYKECPCVKKDEPITYVDNLIFFNNKYLPIEVKLNIQAEKNLKLQCKQYCSLDKIFFQKINGKEVPKDKIFKNNVLVIDTNGIYLYSERNNYLYDIINFDSYNCKDNISELKELIKIKCETD